MKKVISALLILTVVAAVVVFAVPSCSASNTITLADLDSLPKNATLTKDQVLALVREAYAQGYEDAKSGSSQQKPSTVTASVAGSASSDGNHYVLNTNTKKFHYPWCNSVDQMKEKNRQDFFGSREEVIGKGYKPCGNCHP